MRCRVPTEKTRTIFACFAVLIVSACMAFVSARPFAGGWNDGSRLATVECLVDYRTLAIDQSIFVRIPHDPGSPYCPNDDMVANGTCDKLLINGRFYSDKSPVPAVLMAGIYALLQFLTGITARCSPAFFCYIMTVSTSGAAYVAAAWCVFQMGRTLLLSPLQSTTLALAFALGTVAPTYAEHVNNHILLLGVTGPVMLLVMKLPGADEERRHWRLLWFLGALTGLGYTIDLGAGPVMLACTLMFVANRYRNCKRILAVAAGALPFIFLHHALNYSIGGSWKPANAIPEYFAWEGCPFNSDNLTGAWHDRGLGRLV